MNHSDEQFDWSPGQMIEVELNTPDDFLKIRETLTRIGVSSRKKQTLYQSCHILHKQGKYYIVHFKELFALDGKTANISISDIQRRDTIARLLEDWGLLKLMSDDVEINKSMLSQIKIISHKDKSEWELVSKYSIGKVYTLSHS